MCCHCCFGDILAKVKLALSPLPHDRTVLTIEKKKEVEIKIDTKVTSTHPNVSKHGNKPIRISGYYQYLAQSARKNRANRQSTIGFGFTSHWLKNWRETLKPISKCSSSHRLIAFDSYLNTALIVINAKCQFSA